MKPVDILGLPILALLNQLDATFFVGKFLMAYC